MQDSNNKFSRELLLEWATMPVTKFAFRLLLELRENLIQQAVYSEDANPTIQQIRGIDLAIKELSSLDPREMEVS